MPKLQNALSHISLGTNQFEQAIAFYDAVLAPLGIRRVLDLSEHRAIAYGRAFPELWIQAPHDGQPAQTANGVHIDFLAENNAQEDAFYADALAHGVHIAFLAENNAQVDAFYAAALAHGAKPDGAPGNRPHYGDAYYGCFVRDLDGHKIEAMAWNE